MGLKDTDIVLIVVCGKWTCMLLAGLRIVQLCFDGKGLVRHLRCTVRKRLFSAWGRKREGDTDWGPGKGSRGIDL